MGNNVCRVCSAAVLRAPARCLHSSHAVAVLHPRGDNRVGAGKGCLCSIEACFIGQITARGEWCTSVATTNSAKRMVCCGCRVPCTTQEEMEAIVASAVAAQKKWREVYFVDVICDLKSRYEAKCRCTLALSHTRTTFFTRIVAYTDTSAAAHPRAHQVSAAAR